MVPAESVSLMCANAGTHYLLVLASVTVSCKSKMQDFRFLFLSFLRVHSVHDPCALLRCPFQCKTYILGLLRGADIFLGCLLPFTGVAAGVTEGGGGCEKKKIV